MPLLPLAQALKHPLPPLGLDHTIEPSTHRSSSVARNYEDTFTGEFRVLHLNDLSGRLDRALLHANESFAVPAASPYRIANEASVAAAHQHDTFPIVAACLNSILSRSLAIDGFVWPSVERTTQAAGSTVRTRIDCLWIYQTPGTMRILGATEIKLPGTLHIEQWINKGIGRTLSSVSSSDGTAFAQAMLYADQLATSRTSCELDHFESRSLNISLKQYSTGKPS
jgi:hypothetical protein